jgi:predicted DsbA family dithiol-disulfide isomerase
MTSDFELLMDFGCPESRIAIKRILDLPQRPKVTLLPLRLDPAAPAYYGHSTVEHLCAAMNISETAALALLQKVESRFAEYSLAVDFVAARGCNTLKAHVLLQQAHDFGLQLEFAAAVFDAHFANGRLISDAAVLLEIGISVGLPKSEIQAILESPEAESEVLEIEAGLLAEGFNRTPTARNSAGVVDLETLVSA